MNIKYKIDNFTKIGTTHHNNQDYSIIGNRQDLNYIIVSDGCSSSKNTDFGSKILCKCAENFIQQDQYLYNNIINLKQDNDTLDYLYDYIGNSIIYASNDIVRLLNLNSTCLDATLMIGLIYKDVVFYFIYGDGNIMFKSNEMIYLNTIEFKQNAPYYLSYRLDKSREELYFNTFTDNDIKINYYKDNEKVNVINKDIKTNNKIYGTSYYDIDWFSLCTDGLESFNNDNNIITANDLYEDILNFKNYNGEFVKRRLASFYRCNKNIKNYDDFTLAVIKIIDKELK